MFDQGQIQMSIKIIFWRKILNQRIPSCWHLRVWWLPAQKCSLCPDNLEYQVSKYQTDLLYSINLYIMELKESYPDLILHEAIHLKENIQQSVHNHQETDCVFLTDLKQVADKKKSTMKELKESEEYQFIDDNLCEEIQQIALKHRHSNIFNQTSMEDFEVQLPENKCHCGCQRGLGQSFSILIDQEDMFFLGPGILLFFFYLKMVRTTVLLAFSSYGYISLLVSLLKFDFDTISSTCQDQSAINWVLCRYTVITTSKNYWESGLLEYFILWLGFIMCTCWLISTLFIHYLGKQKDSYIDDCLVSASDYTIRIDDLPPGNYNQEDVINFVKELWDTRLKRSSSTSSCESSQNFNDQKLRLRSIQLIYNMEAVRKIISKILETSYQMAQLLENMETVANTPEISTVQPVEELNIDQIILERKGERKNSLVKRIQKRQSFQQKAEMMLSEEQVPNQITVPKKIKKGKQKLYLKMKRQLYKLKQQINSRRNDFLLNSESRQKQTTSCALLQFQSEEQQIEFKDNFAASNQQGIKLLCSRKTHVFRGSDNKTSEVKISRAAEPSDMNWLNCEIEFSYFRQVLIWSALFAILLASYWLVSFFKSTQFFKVIGVLITSIVLQCFNRIIWISLTQLVTYQYNNTKTDAVVSLMKKSVFAQFINVIASPTVHTLFVANGKISGFQGVTGSVLSYQFIMFFMMLIFYVFNPFVYYKKALLYFKCTRNNKIRSLIQIVGDLDTFQQMRPVLDFYQGPQFPIAGGYVYMTTAIFHSLYYCYLQPTILLVLAINITGFQLITKYLLFRRCRIPDLTEIQIFDFSLFVLSCGGAIYGIGSAIFIIKIAAQESQGFPIFKLIPSVLCIVMWFIVSLNPFDIKRIISEFLIDYSGYSLVSDGEDEFNQQQEKMKNNFLSNLIQFSKKIPSEAEEKKEAEKQKQNANKQPHATKATRKESYHEYSNVMKLLNYQTQLKETVGSFHKKNNIIIFCSSFFKKDIEIETKGVEISGCKSEEDSIENKKGHLDDKYLEIAQFKIKKKRLSQNKRASVLSKDGKTILMPRQSLKKSLFKNSIIKNEPAHKTTGNSPINSELDLIHATKINK